MSKFKISGQERRNLKKLLHEYKSYEKGFWHYHQLDKDMCAFVTPTGGAQKDTKTFKAINGHYFKTNDDGTEVTLHKRD
jgi:hypothetical protein